MFPVDQVGPRSDNSRNDEKEQRFFKKAVQHEPVAGYNTQIENQESHLAAYIWISFRRNRHNSELLIYGDNKKHRRNHVQPEIDCHLSIF